VNGAPVLISAHRCGAPKGAADDTILAALEAILRSECEYVEVDVLRTHDGHFVVLHDHHVPTAHGHKDVAELSLDEVRAALSTVITFDEVLHRLRGQKGLHLDLKFASPDELYEAAPDACFEVLAAQRAVEVLGADMVLVTTLEDRAVRAVRTWSATKHPELLVGLSLGRSRAGLAFHRQVMGRLTELFPASRIARCDANAVVANHWLAWLGVARWTGRRHLPLIVWTVDARRGLTHWLRDHRVWMVTTNQTSRAIRIRRRLHRA
jgi:glycerophosphoryl diester phosphodiesterase